MKVFVFALLLLVAITTGEALICYSCNSSIECKNLPEKVCTGHDDVCVATYRTRPPLQSRKMCMPRSEANKLQSNGDFVVYVCEWNRCN